jgi:hypothetical protein
VADSERNSIIWRKSKASESGSGNCVEVAFADESVLVRCSRNPLGSVLHFSRPEWTVFVGAVKNGGFDPGQVGHSPA